MSHQKNRRDFLKTTAVVGAGAGTITEVMIGAFLSLIHI